MNRLRRSEEVEEKELPLFVLQGAYNELVERRRELELEEEMLLQEIQYRLQMGDMPMEEVTE